MEETATKSYNLILSRSGYEYIAPDSGYFVLSANANKVGEQIKLGNNEVVIAKEENENLTAVCKALKGDKVRVEYTTTGNLNFFKFIVAPAIQVMATSSSPILAQMNANLPMDKPTKPTSNMPSSFGGIKNDFSDELKANGYEYDKPAVLGGDNLNFLIDAMGTAVQYYTAIADYFCSIEPDKTPVVDYANRLSQTEYAFKVYDENEIYGAKKTAVVIDELDNTKFYVSLQDGNQGHPVTDGEWWRETGFSVPLATLSDYGIVKPDGETIIVENGVIKTSGVASLDKVGSVKPDGDTITVDDDGTIHANGTAIGDPIPTFSNTLNDNEIWLEGAKVLKETYPLLTNVYGDTYAPEETDDTDIYLYLPDCRDKVFWGTNEETGFGYIEAGLPNITGNTPSIQNAGMYGIADGCFGVESTLTTNDQEWSGSGLYSRFNFNASWSNSIYGKSDTVQPPSIKVRVKTRYK